MPPAKKQKATRDSDGHSSDSAFESAKPRKIDKGKNAKSKGDKSQNSSVSKESKDPEPYDYICISRPFFDVKAENWLTWSNDPDAHLDEDDLFDEMYKPILEQEKKDSIFKSPPEKHPEHKWVMMASAWLKLDWLCRKARYCDPDLFGLSLYTDWKAWGLVEILENTVRVTPNSRQVLAAG